MSHNSARFPIKDDENNNYYNKVVPFINDAANQLRFKTQVSVLAALNGKYELWGPNWIKLNDSTLCTHAVVELKDTLEVQIDVILDAIYGDIPDSVLTADDKAKFLIFERKAASGAVVSPIAPGFELNTAGHLWAKVLFHNTATPGSKSSPVGNFIFFETCVGLPGILPADIVFANGNVTTSSNHTFHFTEDQVGKTCYVHCYYQIKKGDRSPASVIISFVIM